MNHDLPKQANKMSLNDFIVKKVIGEGSYGRAVLCKMISTNKLVVIKEIALSKLTHQEQKDAWKETKVLSLLHHPNIISYYGCFLEKQILHIVMEYADNGDLGEEIKKAQNNNQHFDEDQILDWFVQICLAIKHLHDRKILHRDIKNQNIFLLKDNTAKLGDFGIAKMLDNTTQLSSTAIGTPYYLSPEICQGKPYNMKSDIWSLGCILYELCALRHPFDSTCLNGLIIQIQRSKPAPIPYYYNSNLRLLVDKLLQKVPAKRPSVHEILEFDFIKSRIPKFLSNTIQTKEFCHTILHDFKPGDSPSKAKITPEDVENNNAGLQKEMHKNQENIESYRKTNISRRNALNNNKIKYAKYQVKPGNNEKKKTDEPIPISFRNSQQTKKSNYVVTIEQKYPVQETDDNNTTENIKKSNPKNEMLKIAKSRSAPNFESPPQPKATNVTQMKPTNITQIKAAPQPKPTNVPQVKTTNKTKIKKTTTKKQPEKETYMSKADQIQARKRAMVCQERQLALELREKREEAEQLANMKNELRRNEILEKKKQREMERKEMMERLRSEARKQQEKFKNLQPTFKIDKNVKPKETTKRALRTENENKYVPITNKENDAPCGIFNSDDANQNKPQKEIDWNSNKNKREENLKALRGFIHKKRSEMRTNKQREDIILIGNMEISLDSEDYQTEQPKPEEPVVEPQQPDIEKEILKKKAQKQVADEIYGIIFNNQKVDVDEFHVEEENYNIEIQQNEIIEQTTISNDEKEQKTVNDEIEQKIKTVPSSTESEQYQIESSYLATSSTPATDSGRDDPLNPNSKIPFATDSPVSESFSPSKNQSISREIIFASPSSFDGGSNATSPAQKNTPQFSIERTAFEINSPIQVYSPFDTTKNTNMEHTESLKHETINNNSKSPISIQQEKCITPSLDKFSPCENNSQEPSTPKLNNSISEKEDHKTTTNTPEVNESNSPNDTKSQEQFDGNSSFSGDANRLLQDMDKVLMDHISEIALSDVAPVDHHESCILSDPTSAKNSPIKLGIEMKKGERDRHQNNTTVSSSNESETDGLNIKFFFQGKQLNFESVNHNDSLSFKIEMVRQFVEDGLGINKMIDAYLLAKEKDTEKYKELLTTPQQQDYYQLILQLITAEETLDI